MSSRLSNRNFILIAAVLAAISLTYGIIHYRQAFPEIGINFKVSREQALQNAREFLSSRKFDLSGCKDAIAFNYDDDAKTYLEKELGPDRLAALGTDSIKVWFWQTRFFRPLEKLEYRVQIDPSGRLVGFKREVDESAPGPKLDTLSARSLTEAFIAGPMGINLDKWRLVESSAIDRPARRDHTFTYELNGFLAKDAPYRMTVEVQGAEVSSFRQFLRVPEDWWREWDKQRSQNEMFSLIATFIAFLTLFGVLIYFFRNIKLGQIGWKATLWIAGILAFLEAVAVVNSLPLLLHSYQTTQSWPAFYAATFLGALLAGLGQGILLLALFGAGERLYREDHPNLLRIPAIFTKRGIQSKEFFQATVMGYLLAAFDIGFVVFYYTFGKRFGFWSPVDIKYDNAVSTAIPWIYPLAIAMGAALSEEFWFRVFGIPFFKRLTNSKVLAVIIPAFIWGFLHSNYPQQPGYVRGIEVGIIGLFAGIVLLRFGVWAVLVYHYVIDAVLIGFFLFQSQNLYFWISGLIVCGVLLVPAGIAGVSYLRRRSFEPVDDLLNGAPVEAPPPKVQQDIVTETAAAPAGYIPLGMSRRRAGWIVGIVGALLALIPAPDHFPKDFSLKVTQGRAIALARKDVEARYHVSTDSFKVAILSFNTGEGVRGNMQPGRDEILSYVKHYGSDADAEKLFRGKDGAPRFEWYVMFKKPLQPIEFSSDVRMENEEARSWITISDSAVGPSIPHDSAQAIAEAKFKELEPNNAAYTLIEDKSISRPHRTDWKFTWETTEPVFKEAKFRREIFLKANYVDYSDRWLKVPETWIRHEDEQRLGMVILQAITTLVLLVLVIWILVTLGKQFKRGEVTWKYGIIAGVIVAVLGILDEVNHLPTLWFFYNTSEPVTPHLLGYWLASIASVIQGLMVVVFIALLEAIAKGQFSMSPLSPPPISRRSMAMDDAVAAVGTFGALAGLHWLLSSVASWVGLPVHNFDFQLPEAINRSYPWLSGICNDVSRGITVGSLITAIFALLWFAINKHWIRWVAVVVAALFLFAGRSMKAGNLTTGESLWALTQAAVLVLAIVFVMRFWGTIRIRGIIAGFVMLFLAQTGASMVSWSGSPYAIQGWVLLALVVVVPIVMVTRAIRMKGGEK